MGRNYLKLLVFVTLSLLFNIPLAIAGDVSLDPGYITGQVRMGNADATFNTTGISTNASGGGYTASKSTSNNSNYQMTVQGGDWNYNVTASATFNGTNSSPNTSNSGIYVVYNNRSVQVSPGEFETNDYVNNGAIKFILNITGDASTRFDSQTYWYAQKATTATERTYTRFAPTNSTLATHRNAYWYVPVAPNQGIAVSGGNIIVYCSTGYQIFPINKSVDVNPGETVEVPIDINFTCPPPPGGGGGSTPCTAKPFSVTGKTEIPGVQASDFYRTTGSGNYFSFTAATNPYNYIYNTSYCADTLTGYAYPTTSFIKTGSNAEGSLTWPYLGGNSLNNRVTLLANQTVTKDYTAEAVPISGEIRYTGTVTNADLNQYTVNFTGEPKVYKNGAWIQNLPANYGSLSFTRNMTTTNYKRPSQLSYYNYLTPGDWYTGQWTARKLVTTPYRKQSDMNFIDYNNHYDGYTYNFGTPIHVESGVPATKNFEYCMGSAIFRFRVVGGGLLSNPYINGSGSHKNSSNKTDMSMSVTGQSTISLNSAPEVEIFGPTGNYTLSTVRVYAQDGSLITFPPINVSLACNTTKIFDIPGPTLNVTSPQGELITNVPSISVTGRAFSGSSIDSITINGQVSALTPITGGKNNEVAFTRELPLANGKNTVNVIATDVSGAQATDQIIVAVDRWQPTANISNGDRFPNTEASIPFTVQAADRGYGYTLQVSLDGVVISTITGAANDTTPVPVSYAGALTNIALGIHVITAVATDLAGNSTTATATIEIYEARDNNPPTITRLGDAAVTVEAGSIYADAGATALDDRDGNITASIVTANPVNPMQLGSHAVTYNVSDAAGNPATEVTRQVTVVDTTAPLLTVPSDLTVEAAGQLTAVSTGQTTATDLFAVTVTNNAPASYPLGTTAVTWMATDVNGNATSAVQTITVRDTTAPVVTAPANITVEATGGLTTVATGNATATDAVGPVTISDNAPATFPLGTTSVIWTTVDGAGNTSNATQTVTVVDITPPALHGLVNRIIEATSAAGSAVSFSVTATDIADAAPVAICSSASGSTFPLGTTTVTCVARDSSNNSSSGSFTIRVQDTTPPALAVHADITVILNTPFSAPAVQAFLNGASATDIVDAAVATSFTTPSLDTVGSKQVTFTAVDDFGNTTVKTATIFVKYGCTGVFQPPVSLLKPFKLGSTIPVKFGLCDANGAAVTTAVAKLYLQQYSGDEPVGDPIEVTSTSEADTGNFFRLASDSMYIYNLYTKSLSSGTFRIQAALDDGSVNTISLFLKQ